MPEEERVVIRRVQRPAKENPDELIRYFCKAFDLGEESLEPEILKEVIEKNIEGSGITSKELNGMLNIPRSTIIYHLNRFIGVGLIERKGRKYFLRENDLAGTIEEIENDVLRNFSKLIEFAEKFDEIAWDNYGRKEGRRKRKY